MSSNKKPVLSQYRPESRFFRTLVCSGRISRVAKPYTSQKNSKISMQTSASRTWMVQGTIYEDVELMREHILERATEILATGVDWVDCKPLSIKLMMDGFTLLKVKTNIPLIKFFEMLIADLEGTDE